MTSDDDLRGVLRMLGRAVYSWGVHSLDGDATDERRILDDLSTEARAIAERFVRRNVLGSQSSRVREYARFRGLELRSRDIIIDDGVRGFRRRSNFSTTSNGMFIVDNWGDSVEIVFHKF